MDDIMEKLGELLSDEESVKEIVELAKMMTSEEAVENGAESENKNTEGAFDIGSLTKLTSLIGAASQKDKNAELLLALKPHLKEEKRERVDKALKLLKLIAVWNMAKESGLLNDIL